MKFEDSPISKDYSFTKKTFDFGIVYFLDKIVLAEMNYGIHLSWSKIQVMIDEIISFYGLNCKIGYISNKTNSYSYEPSLWNVFYKNYDFIVASASIYYSELNYINATMEKHFSKKSIKRSKNLEEAFEWIYGIKELKD